MTGKFTTLRDLLSGAEFLFIREDFTTIGVMRFNADGTIDRYHNSNEHSWRLEGEELQILREDGQVCSRWRSLAMDYSQWMGWMGFSEWRGIGFEKSCERLFLQQVKPYEANRLDNRGPHEVSGGPVSVLAPSAG